MWIGGIKVPKLINWLQRKFYDSSPDFVANTYRTSEDALIKWYRAVGRFVRFRLFYSLAVAVEAQAWESHLFSITLAAGRPTARE